MRVMLAVVVMGGMASADPYPLEITDRPILLQPGMTELRFSIPWQIKQSGIHGTSGADLAVGHAFGDIELDAGLGQLATISAMVETHSILGVLGVGARFSARQQDHSYAESQFATIEKKLVLIPRRVAVFTSATLDLIEHSVALRGGGITDGHFVFADLHVTGELQLTKRIGIYATLDGSAALAESSSLNGRPAIEVPIQILCAWQRWDFFLDVELDDVTRDPSLFLGVGLTKRWGL